MTDDIMIYDMGRLGQSDFLFCSAVHNSNFWAWLSSATLRFLIDPKNIKTQKKLWSKNFHCMLPSPLCGIFWGWIKIFSDSICRQKDFKFTHTHTCGCFLHLPLVWCNFILFGLVSSEAYYFVNNYRIACQKK